MVRWIIRAVMTMLGRRPAGEERSRDLHVAADSAIVTERARLARLRPIIDRLPTRQDWDRLYAERNRDGR